MCAARGADSQEGSNRAPSYPIESVDNALRLLILVAKRGHVRVSEASTELGTAVSTAHRLLAMLAHHDLVIQDSESKVYKAGPALVRIGLDAVKNLDVRVLARPFLEALRDELNETVHLAVLQGKDVMFIDCVESPNALRVVSRSGTLMPASCTSVGKALLARQPDAVVKSLYRSARLPTLTDYSLTQRAELLVQLEEVRRDGYAHNSNESEVGVGSVSAAICDSAGRAVAGISVAVPLVRMPEERWSVLAAAVMRTAEAVGGTLP